VEGDGVDGEDGGVGRAEGDGEVGDVEEWLHLFAILVEGGV
jgi:hypothetical protein